MDTGIPQCFTVHLWIGLDGLGSWHHIFGVPIDRDKLHPIALACISASLVDVVLEEAGGLS